MPRNAVQLGRIRSSAWVAAAIVALVGAVSATAFVVVGTTQADPRTSEQQQQVVADDVVTYEEHEQAIRAYIECARAAGMEPTVEEGSGLRPTRVTFALPRQSDPEDTSVIEAAQNVFSDCASQHLDEVDTAWALEKPEPSEAHLAALYEDLRSCVQSGGRPEISVGPASYYGLYKNAPERSIEIGVTDGLAYRQCAVALEAETGLTAPPPVLAR